MNHVVFSLIFLASTFALEAEEIHLQKLYFAAVKNTAIVKDRIIQEQIAREQKSQVRGNLLPDIALASDHTWRDPVPSLGGFGQDYQYSNYLKLDQKLFQGGAEYYGIKIAKNLPKIAEFQKKQQQIELFERLSQLYFNALTLETDLKLLTDQSLALRAQVSTLQKRAAIGRNKQTDVLSARAEKARIDAEISQRESELNTRYLQLAALTGMENIGSLSDPYKEKKLQVEPNWKQLLEQTPIVKIQELQIENNQSRIEVAQANFYPDLDLNGNYYFGRQGALGESDWDVGVSLSWNLFSGGKDRAEKRVQFLEKMRIEERLKDIKRNLLSDFSALEKEFYAQKNILEKLQKSVDLSRRNYREHIREEKRGLVNQLDVLRVQKNYLDSQRVYNQQFYQTRVLWIRLRSLAGVTP